MCAKSESKIPSAVSEEKMFKDKLTGQRTPSDMAIAELTWPNNLFFTFILCLKLISLSLH